MSCQQIAISKCICGNEGLRRNVHRNGYRMCKWTPMHGLDPGNGGG